MEHTEGVAKRAEVWLAGRLLTVCDGVSSAGRRCEPGELKNVGFHYVNEGGVNWDEAAAGNPSWRQSLEHVRDWSYEGFGRVVSIMPVVIDFGLLRMEDANWTTDESLIGRYVRIPIGRLEICPATEPDWPEEMR